MCEDACKCMCVCAMDPCVHPLVGLSSCPSSSSRRQAFSCVSPCPCPNHGSTPQRIGLAIACRDACFCLIPFFWKYGWRPRWFVVCKWLDCLVGRCVSAGSDGVVLSFFIQFPTIIVPQTPQILSGERSALEPVQAGMDLPGDGGDLVRHALLFGTGLRRFCCWLC